MSRTDHITPTRKTALAPDLRTLDDRAARAWTERMAVRPLGGGRYAVESQSENVYTVDALAGDCSCPDHSIRGERCKHLRRVAIEITAGRIPAPGRRAAACAQCGERTYVPVDADAPILCSACRLDPGERVVDRETGDSLLVVRVTDGRADSVHVEAAGCTVAEYPTNSAYPADDLVVEAVYAGDGERTYAFPYSRLAGHAVTEADAVEGGPERPAPPV